jgi:hypothetical protein
MPALLQRLHQPKLVFREYPRNHITSLNVLDHSRAAQNLRRADVAANSHLCGDGARGGKAVTGDHHDAHTQILEALH